MRESIQNVLADYRYRYREVQNGFDSGWNAGGFTAPYSGLIVKPDNSTRNWRNLIANGLNATTDLTADVFTFNVVPANIHHWVQLKEQFEPPKIRIDLFLEGNMIFPNSLGLLNNPIYSIESADNQALTKLYEHLASVESKFKGLTFTGELRESLAMIRHPARAFRRGVGSYLDKLGRVGRSIPRSRRQSWVRETWLEYAFGWRPLISDIDSAIKAFYLSQAAHPLFEMVRGRGKTSEILDDTLLTANVGYGYNVSWRNNATKLVEVKYYGSYHSSGAGIPDSHTYGFRPSEFIPTLWELIPYSFLVDYFTNIGNIINSWSYRFLSLAWCSKTVFSETSIVSSDERYFKGDPSQYHVSQWDQQQIGTPGSSAAYHRNIQRYGLVSPGVPSLELRIPGFDARWVNIIALSKNVTSARRSLRT